MAYEFRALYGAAKNRIPPLRLARELQKLGRYHIESVDERKLSLRFPDAKRRSSWPEDASILLDEDGVTVAVHSGTSIQRTRLIEDLTKVYSVLGIPVRFCED